jgi:hypothetical protein
MSNDRKPASLKSRRRDLEAAPAVVTLEYNALSFFVNPGKPFAKERSRR